MTARLVAAVDDEMPRIEYRHFQFVDQDGATEPPDGWSDTPGLLASAGRGVLLRTAGNDFYPVVRLEVWSSEPQPQSEGEWEDQDEATFTSETGLGLLREWDGGPVGSPLELGNRGSYRLRAYCRGRAQAEALIGEEMFYEGVEKWLLQVWPAEAQA